MTGAMVLAVLFTVALWPLYVFRTEPVSDALEVCSTRERRSYWLAVAALSAHITLSCVLLACVPSLAPLRTAVGVATFVAGISFWLWARRAIGPLRNRRIPDQPPERCRFDGPFGIVRNPLYFALLLICAGLGISAGHVTVWATFAACIAALDLRARDEEKRMRAQVGAEYGSYQLAVKRLIPFLW